jgi:hypothetical protein
MRAIFFVGLKGKSNLMLMMRPQKEKESFPEKSTASSSPVNRKIDQELARDPTLTGNYDFTSCSPNSVDLRYNKKGYAKHLHLPRVESPLVRAGKNSIQMYGSKYTERISMSPVRESRNIIVTSKKQAPYSSKKITLNICKKSQKLPKL